MDRRPEICAWFRKMGFDGEFPESFDSICNNSTSFIWDQLMENTRTKKEVEHMRDNIIVSRLSNQSNNEENFPYCLEEINLYSRKKDLQSELQKLNYSLTEKQNINSQLLQQNKIKRFSIQQINLKIRESEEREYLLRRKLNLLEKDIEDAENILNIPIRILIENQMNSKDIKCNLKKCEEKIQEDIEQLPLPIKNKFDETFKHAQKSTRKNNTSKKYKNYVATQKTKKNKIHDLKTEKIRLNKANVCLFLSEQKSDRRELNVDCDDDDENFLVNVRKPITGQKGKLYNPFSKKKNMDGSLLIRNRNVSNNQRDNECLIKNIFNESISNNIRELLHQYSAPNIWNEFEVLNDNLHFNISKKINFRQNEFFNKQNHKIGDMARLQSLHVLTELKILKNNNILKQLTEKFNKKKKNIILSWVKSGYPNEVLERLHKTFNLQIKDIGLESSLEVMKKQISIRPQSAESSDILNMKQKMLEIKDGIVLKKKSIIQYLDIIQDIFHLINRTHIQTSSCVKRLAPYSSDLNWCSLLEKNVNVHEMIVFDKFPLEYNRKCINTDHSVYYRDLDINRFLYNREIDNDNLIMLSNILESPFTAPETVISKILREKCMLEAMKSIELTDNNSEHQKYSLTDLEKQESYIIYSLEQFNSLIASSSSKRTLLTASVTKEIMEMWIEMPFKKCISPSRTCEDKDYDHYEKLFDFYNNS